MYNPMNILKQSPETIKTTILLILAALVIQGTINISGEQTAAWGLALERFLEMLYVAPTQKANLKADLEELNQ
jgi:hypothetical protein